MISIVSNLANKYQWYDYHIFNQHKANSMPVKKDVYKNRNSR